VNNIFLSARLHTRFHYSRTVYFIRTKPILFTLHQYLTRSSISHSRFVNGQVHQNACDDVFRLHCRSQLSENLPHTKGALRDLRFEICATVSLRMQLLWRVTLRLWVIGSRSLEATYSSRLQGSKCPRTLRCLETSRSFYASTQNHIRKRKEHEAQSINPKAP
jgi:hypothetical protein